MRSGSLGEARHAVAASLRRDDDEMRLRRDRLLDLHVVLDAGADET